MATVIDCGKVNPVSGCGHVIRADSEEEALRLAAEHAQKDHGMQPTPELMAKVKEHMDQT
jgi:predicted small metal-binding protein